MSNYNKRVMVFIDATNFLSGLAREIGVTFDAFQPPDNVFEIAKDLLGSIGNQHAYIVDIKIRTFWFGSCRRDFKKLLCNKIRDIGFEPVLFEQKHKKEKGLDIALAKEMLINAFNQNYDLGYLIAGDADYIDLVKEVKRYGQIIHGAFFERRGLSPDLRVAFDEFKPIKIDEQKKKKYKEDLGNDLKEISNSGDGCSICRNAMTGNQYDELYVGGEDFVVCPDCLASVKNHIEGMKSREA